MKKGRIGETAPQAHSRTSNLQILGSSLQNGFGAGYSTAAFSVTPQLWGLSINVKEWRRRVKVINSSLSFNRQATDFKKVTLRDGSAQIQNLELITSWSLSVEPVLDSLLAFDCPVCEDAGLSMRS